VEKLNLKILGKDYGIRARIYYIIRVNKKYSEELSNYYDSLFNKVSQKRCYIKIRKNLEIVKNCEIKGQVIDYMNFYKNINNNCDGDFKNGMLY